MLQLSKILTAILVKKEADMKNFETNDEIYNKDIEDLKILERKYENLDLSIEQRMIIEDYIACMSSAMERKFEIMCNKLL